MEKNKRRIWQYPWGYAESLLIALSLMLLGFAITYVTNGRISTLSWPVNLYTGLIFLFLLLVVHVFFRDKPVVKWLSSMYAAVGAIGFYAFLVLLMGFIPQGTSDLGGFFSRIGLNNLVSSHAFLFAQFYFLLTLGLVTLRRIIPFKLSNIAFFLNHFGLWLALFAASIGAGDLQQLSITVGKNSPVFSAVGKKGELIPDLGIAVQLDEFLIEEYSPKAFVIDAKSGELLTDKFFYLEKGNKADILNWNIEVVDFFKYAMHTGDKFYSVYDVGAAPAANVIAINKKTGERKEAWISCGSFRFPASFLALSDKVLLVMADPEPKRYSSKVKVYKKSGDIVNATVEVNKPLSVAGWKIYQTDYDHTKGRWSEISVLGLVKDPWIPVVYLGIFMMIIGSLYIFWGRNKKK